MRQVATLTKVAADSVGVILNYVLDKMIIVQSAQAVLSLWLLLLVLVHLRCRGMMGGAGRIAASG